MKWPPLFGVIKGARKLPAPRKFEMDESIGTFSKCLAAFCNHLQSSCDALKQSVDRRPIPLDSASTTFMQCLNRRVSSISGDLNLLESMSFDTVSFEELLGHCTQVYNKNQIDILALQDHLVSTSSYVPSADSDEEERELDDFSPHVRSSALPLNKLEDDLLLDDSLSLKNLGLSDACLATIATEADDGMEKKATYQSGAKIFTEIEGEKRDEPKPFEDSKSLINVSRDDYENLPRHMKSLASWEDIVAAVEKINSCLLTRSSKLDTFRQDEIASLELGYKGRSYLLLLIRMEHIVVETIDGVIRYRILSTQ